MHTPDGFLPSHGVQARQGSGAVGGSMQDLGWLLFVVMLFVLARALVRLCERLM